MIDYTERAIYSGGNVKNPYMEDFSNGKFVPGTNSQMLERQG